MPQPFPPDTDDGSTAQARLSTILTEALRPSWLEVVDESHLHAGHAGWRPGGETHMRVRVVSDVFTGKSRIARHRLVNELAATELQAGLHALAIEARAPGEDALHAHRRADMHDLGEGQMTE